MAHYAKSDECNKFVRGGGVKMENLHEVDDFIRVMIDAAPFGTHIWDKNLQIIDCNQATANLFKLSNKQEYLKNFNNFSPEYQPDGSLSKETAVQYIRKAFEEGYLQAEWMHRALDGELIPSEMTLVRVDSNNNCFVVVYVRDLREEKRMIREIEAAQFTLSTMFESNPHINVLFDSSFNVVDCNPAAVRFMGFETKDELYAGFVERMAKSIPEFQPDGRPSIPLAERLMTAVKEGYANFETEVFMCGVKRDLNVEFKRIPYENSFAIVGYVLDMTDAKNLIQEIENRTVELEQRTNELESQGRLMRAINNAAVLLLESETSDYGGAMRKGMEMIGRCLEVDRVIVWQNILKDDGKLYLQQMHLWTSERLPDEGLFGVSQDELPNWAIPVSQGEIINGPITDQHEKEQVHSMIRKIESILIIPIFLKNEFWGLISFDDCSRRQSFPEEVVRLLHSWGLLAVGSIQRGNIAIEMKNTLNKLENQTSVLNVLNDMSIRFISQTGESFEEKMTAGVKLIVDMMDLDSMSVWRNFMMSDDIYTSQIYRWDKDAGGTVSPRPELQNVPLDQFSSHWEKILAGEKVLNGPVRLMDDPPAAFERFGVISALLTPLFFNNEYWGFVLFEDLHNERYFDDVQFMRSAAFLCANTVMRSEMENKLKEALRDATSASRAKGDFLANMSHEIRTPMNAIIGMTNIGKSATDMERMAYSFTKIEDASKHLLGIINDILDMSKIEAGKFELVPVEFDFEKMLQRVVNVVHLRADEREQKLTVHVDRDIPQFLFGDDQRLAQVITNLLGNAVKFTPEKGTIGLNTYYSGEENGICTIKIAVTDTGIGISPEQQVSLFQSFQQAETNTSRKFGGTGLGLTISKSIVEMMGGEIDVESEIGKGSVFTFTIQIKRSEKKGHIYSGQRIDWKSVRVLAVDDDVYILEEFKNIMNGFGASCDIAESAEDALRLVEQDGDYNIYFVDWKMPDIDGIELTKELKKRKHTQRDPIVIMISSAESSLIAAEAKEAGVEKFLQKPLFPSTIADIISEYLYLEVQQPEEAVINISGIFDGHHILLAEDMEINREIVLALLEPTNIVIDCAVNGVEAVRMFSNAPDKYEMIFMDLQMPELDGYQATKAIRALDLPRAKTIPIVAMTANVFKEDVEKCLEAGMNGHVGKPIDFNEVISQLRLYIQ